MPLSRRIRFTCSSVDENGVHPFAEAAITVNVTGINIINLVPAQPVVGKDEIINYKISGATYDSVSLEIKNSNGVVVFKQDGLPGDVGGHNVTWTAVKWNQAPNAGAFANPKNGAYTVKVIGKKGAAEDTDSRSVALKLIIEADLKDEKPAGSVAARASGLTDVISALKIVMSLNGAETIVSGAGSITVTGADAFNKHIAADAGALNTLADGQYDVLLRDLRDEIGNFGDSDNNAANGIQPFKFSINLR